MDLTFFATFREVAKRQSFTRAAEELGYAQSSVTAQVQKLERAYGVQLIERYGRKLRLTAAGEELLRHVNAILAIYEESKEAVASQAAGVLSIGAIDSLASYELPPLLQQLRIAYPDLSISLHTDSEAGLLDKIRSGQLDIALLLDEKCPDPALHCEIIREERLVLLTREHHPLGENRSTVALQQLEDEEWIMSEEGCYYRTMLERELRDRQMKYRIRYELGNPEAVKRCVRNGLGIALLPELVVREELDRRDWNVLDIERPALQLKLQLVMHPKKWLSQPLLHFITLIRGK